MPRASLLSMLSLAFVMAAGASAAIDGFVNQSVRTIQVQNRPAEGLARILRRVSPPGVRIVRDPGTKKLLITGPAHLLAELFDEPLAIQDEVATQPASREGRRPSTERPSTGLETVPR